MNGTTGERPVVDLGRLRRHLLDRGVEVSGDLRITRITGGRSNLTYRLNDELHVWVLRRPPAAGLTPSAHDVGREYAVVDALQRTGIPVPPTVVSCEDPEVLGAPFTVVGFVPGTVLRTRSELDKVTNADITGIHRELLRVLAALHDLPYQEIGLAGFGRPAGFFQRQLRRWRGQWDRVATRDVPDLDTLYGRLARHPPEHADATVVHGDYRIDNTLLDPADPRRMLALVDWEMSTLGDPLTDLATHCSYRHPAFDHVVGEPAASTSGRWPTTEATARDYAALTGRDLTGFDWYLGLAYLKLAVIAEGILARHLLGAGTADEAGHAQAGAAVPELIAAGLAVLP